MQHIEKLYGTNDCSVRQFLIFCEFLKYELFDGMLDIESCSAIVKLIICITFSETVTINITCMRYELVKLHLNIYRLFMLYFKETSEKIDNLEFKTFFAKLIYIYIVLKNHLVNSKQ